MSTVEERPPDSPENPYAGQGSVLLDIGGPIGALLVTMPVETVGREVEIDRVGHHHHDQAHDHGHRQHVAVVRRPVFGGEVASLVFPELVEGAYELFEKGGHEARLRVEVRGGEVTTAAWPG